MPRDTVSYAGVTVAVGGGESEMIVRQFDRPLHVGTAVFAMVCDYGAALEAVVLGTDEADLWARIAADECDWSVGGALE